MVLFKGLEHKIKSDDDVFVQDICTQTVLEASQPYL